MELQIVLGNQLFAQKYYKSSPQNVFMCEDFSLCTHFKYHKHKIIFFLSSMRHFKKELIDIDKKVHYFELEKKSHFFEKLYSTIKKLKVTVIKMFEIEDKFFESEIIKFCKKNKLELIFDRSPMFLVSRDEFKNYNSTVKKPFMKSFYEGLRKSTNILMEGGKPVGGKFSFDADNRKKIPKKFDVVSSNIKVTDDKITKEVKVLVDKYFSDHPGNSENFWLCVDRKSTLSFLNVFFKEKFQLFGDYEDAIDQRDPFLYHSVLSPYINIGFVTPEEVIKKAISVDVSLNSKEGFIRQVIGWREFMRGIYQEYSHEMETKNFFKHKRKLKASWYTGDTGIVPLDDAIKKSIKYGYCHHIERLMIISNIMLMSEIEPSEVYKWFMEFYVDSSDWVMAPNVFGMGQFSDGGIFATKPYICGSNYILKMSHYKKDNWCDVMDGLYWNFIDKKRDFFNSNHRMKMMVSMFDKMDDKKKKRILRASSNFLKQHTI